MTLGLISSRFERAVVYPPPLSSSEVPHGKCLSNVGLGRARGK